MAAPAAGSNSGKPGVALVQVIPKQGSKVKSCVVLLEGGGECDGHLLRGVWEVETNAAFEVPTAAAAWCSNSRTGRAGTGEIERVQEVTNQESVETTLRYSHLKPNTSRTTVPSRRDVSKTARGQTEAQGDRGFYDRDG